MIMNNEIKTESDLESLIGQYETVRMDFKSARLLGPDKSKPLIIEDLSREVSAFANTEGGMLVIGIETGREAEKAMAVSLSEEGIDPNLRKPEWLQQVVASNISPPLNGLIVKPIPLSGTRKGKVAYVIVVPKGETAYQANDLKYYGRHELESKALADNEIRLRMNRGRASHAIIAIGSLSRVTAADEFQYRMSDLERLNSECNRQEFIAPARRAKLLEDQKRLSGGQRDFDEYSIEFSIRNDGPITIRDCSLLIESTDQEAFVIEPGSKTHRWIFEFLPETETRRSFQMHAGTNTEVALREKKIFPEQTLPFPGAALKTRVPSGTIPKPWNIRWTLYLEDAPPVSGSLDVNEAAARL